jgi:hypothetical protein
MGLRHLPIVNDDNEVMGMITRKDLIEPMIKARYEHLLEQQAMLDGSSVAGVGDPIAQLH